MSGDSFEATFRIKLDRETVWQRLTGKTGDDDEQRSFAATRNSHARPKCRRHWSGVMPGITPMM